MKSLFRNFNFERWAPRCGGSPIKKWCIVVVHLHLQGTNKKLVHRGCLKYFWVKKNIFPIFLSQCGVGIVIRNYYY